jgi:hypothetical protein
VGFNAALAYAAGANLTYPFRSSTFRGLIGLGQDIGSLAEEASLVGAIYDFSIADWDVYVQRAAGHCKPGL